MDAARLEVEAYEQTTEEQMRTLLSLGDRVNDVVVEVVKEFLDRVWRVRAGGHGQREAGLGRLLPRETFVPSTVCGEDGSGAVPCKNAMEAGWCVSVNYPGNCLLLTKLSGWYVQEVLLCRGEDNVVSCGRAKLHQQPQTQSTTLTRKFL